MLNCMKKIHSPLYMTTLTWFFIGMALLDCMHSCILLGTSFSIHSRFYFISIVHRLSCTID
jgi:hypothetical protein